MGHSELDCEEPAARNALGKLPYDIKLRAPEERRKKIQSFSAAAESFGSDSSRHSGFSRRSSERGNQQSQSSAASEKEGAEEDEVL